MILTTELPQELLHRLREAPLRLSAMRSALLAANLEGVWWGSRSVPATGTGRTIWTALLIRKCCSGLLPSSTGRSSTKTALANSANPCRCFELAPSQTPDSSLARLMLVPTLLPARSARSICRLRTHDGANLCGQSPTLARETVRNRPLHRSRRERTRIGGSPGPPGLYTCDSLECPCARSSRLPRQAHRSCSRRSRTMPPPRTRPSASSTSPRPVAPRT